MAIAGIELSIAAIAASVEGNGGNRPKAKHPHSPPPPLNRSTSCLGRKGQVAILEIVRSDVTQT